MYVYIYIYTRSKGPLRGLVASMPAVPCCVLLATCYLLLVTYHVLLATCYWVVMMVVVMVMLLLAMEMGVMMAILYTLCSMPKYATCCSYLVACCLACSCAPPIRQNRSPERPRSIQNHLPGDPKSLPEASRDLPGPPDPPRTWGDNLRGASKGLQERPKSAQERPRAPRERPRTVQKSIQEARNSIL